MPENFLSGQINITSVDLTGTNTAEIANDFCANCPSLTSVTIPSTVSKIGSNVFMHNAQNGALTSITIPNSVTEIGGYFLYNHTNLTSINMSNAITSIGSYFAGNTKITSFTVPSTVTYIGSRCFEACPNFKQLIYNAPIATLPQYLCRETSALELIDLNSSVASISRYDFSSATADNTNLLEVVLRKTDDIVTLPNAIGNTSSGAAFKDRQNIKIYVPTSLIASYQANSNWAAGITAGYLTIVALEGSQYE